MILYSRPSALAIAVFLVLGISPLPAFAAEGSPFSFNVLLYPNTAGTLNGRIDLSYAWLPWLATGFSAYTDNYTRSYDSNTDVSTLSSTSNDLRLDALRINQESLWSLIGTRLDFLRFSAQASAVGEWTTQKRYGYDPSQSTPLFYLDSTDLSSFRPLQSYSLGLSWGPVNLTGRFESTLAWGREEVTSSHHSSAMSSPPPETRILYRIGDTLAGCDLALDFGILKPAVGFEYSLSVITDSTALNTHKSETWTYDGTINLSFIKLAGGSPVVGAAYVLKNEYLAASGENSLTGNIRLEFGLKY